MLPTTRSRIEQERVIEEARVLLAADPRVVACWLEGSFAAGTADAWSDIDLHIAVRDAEFEAVVENRMELLYRIRPVLGHGEGAFIGGGRLIFALLAGGVRFDLYIERLGAVAEPERSSAPRVLFDREEVVSRLRPAEDPCAAIAPWLNGLVQSLFFGATWPVRLWGRQEWGTLQMNALEITFQFLVPLMLTQDDPPNFYRPRYHNEHRLSAARRREIDALVERIGAAFHACPDGAVDQEQVRRLYERLIGRIFGELRAACTRYDVEYPVAAEAEVRVCYRRELQIDPLAQPASV
jgi:predicted nucleotidyltransferase